MRTKVVLSIATMLMLVIGVAAIASNMGFKIDISLKAGGASNWVSLPYHNQYTDAASIFTDVGVATQVSRWDNTTNTFQTYGARGGIDFSIDPGQAYLVKVSVNKDWIVVGSHNPSLALSLQAGGASNWISVPYHTTAADAADLFSQIPNVSQLSRWDNTTNTFQTYGARGGINFPITKGEGVLVKVTSAASWTPAHY